MNTCWTGIKNELNRIYDALCDNESRQLFDARVAYMLDRDGEAYRNKIFELNKRFPKVWHCDEYQKELEESREIIIYGCGHDGKQMRQVLEICGFYISYWCSSNRERRGTYVDGIPVLSPEDLSKEHFDSLVLIGSKKYEHEIRQRLYDVQFCPKNILSFLYHPGVAVCGLQYFDMFPPKASEVFIDAGAYNGETIIDFLSWVKGGRYKIYSIEPLEDMCEIIREKNIPNVMVYHRAAWKCDEMLDFTPNQRGSSVGRGPEQVRGIAIDSMVGDDEVTFIKMDIEGAERNALEGAKNTIEKFHPRLAICIYHKPTDIYEIGKYILELNPDYKLYIRQYAAGAGSETILYAV